MTGERLGCSACQDQFPEFGRSRAGYPLQAERFGDLGEVDIKHFTPDNRGAVLGGKPCDPNMVARQPLPDREQQPCCQMHSFGHRRGSCDVLFLCPKLGEFGHADLFPQAFSERLDRPVGRLKRAQQATALD